MAININPGTPLRQVATFNSSGNWTAPLGTNVAFISIHGASGGGGAQQNRYGDYSAGAGGSGILAGAYVQVTPGSSHVVTIGAAGAAGTRLPNSANQASANSGGAGGSTIFDGAITVVGGNGGIKTEVNSNSPAASGNAGTASGVTNLTTLNPGAATMIRTSTISTQNTGGSSGGAGGFGGSRYSQPNAAGTGAAGQMHIYI